MKIHRTSIVVWALQGVLGKVRHFVDGARDRSSNLNDHFHREIVHAITWK
jgi:hypothetical protein